MKRITMRKQLMTIAVALLTAGALSTSCSNEDNDIDEQLPGYAGYKGIYAMTVQASKNKYPLSRSLSLDNDSIEPKWAATDEVCVFPQKWSLNAKGMLIAADSDNGLTTLTGSLTKAPSVGDTLKLLFPRAVWDYTGQTGVLLSDDNSIEKKYDYALADVAVKEVDGNMNVITDNANFQSQQAIVKFILQDQNVDPINASSLTISAASGKLVTSKGCYTTSRYTGGYYYEDGSPSKYNSYSDNLVDGKISTKWCTHKDDKKSGKSWYSLFHTSKPVHVDGYTLTTGDDNETWNGRNPKDWELQAKAKSSDLWTTIATVRNDHTLKEKNTKSYDFDVDVPGEYQYFRFDVYSTHGADDMQLGELQLFEKTFDTAYGDLTVTPASPTSELTVALRNEDPESDTYKFKAIVGGTLYAGTMDNVIFKAGNYYTVKVKIFPTVTWDSSNCSSLNLLGPGNITIDGITLSCNAYKNDVHWRNGGIEFRTSATGGFTFTAPSGKKFAKIEMTTKGNHGWYTAINYRILGTGWSSGPDDLSVYNKNYIVTWTGNAASVDLLKTEIGFGGNPVTNILFYLSE